MLSYISMAPIEMNSATVLYLIPSTIRHPFNFSPVHVPLLDSVLCLPVNYIMWSYCIQLHMQANLSEWYRVYPCSRVVCAVPFDMCRVALTVHCELFACALHYTYPKALVCTAHVPYQHYLFIQSRILLIEKVHIMYFRSQILFMFVSASFI